MGRQGQSLLQAKHSRKLRSHQSMIYSFAGPASQCLDRTNVRSWGTPFAIGNAIQIEFLTRTLNTPSCLLRIYCIRRARRTGVCSRHTWLLCCAAAGGGQPDIAYYVKNDNRIHSTCLYWYSRRRIFRGIARILRSGVPVGAKYTSVCICVISFQHSADWLI
jgi:hypothetical protein